MSTEVLEKGKGAESAEVKEVVREYASVEALKEAVRGDASIREDYLKNGEKYTIAEPKEEPATPPSQTQPGAVAPETPKPSKKKVTLEVEDEMLGSYAVNREPDAAILEALKGNKEKDKTIDFLKEKSTLKERELAEALASQASLKKQIQEWESKKKEEAAHKADKPKLSEIPELTASDELFDESGQNKLRASLNGSREYISKLESEMAELRNEVKGIHQNKQAEDSVSREFSEIDGLIKKNKEVIETSRSFKEMQDDYIAFMDNLKTVAGVNGPLLAENGNFAPEVQTQYELYNEESEAGKAFRAKCEARGVKTPEDFDALQKVYQIRSIKNNHFERGSDGNPVPISYEKAAMLYLAENPIQDKTKESPAELPALNKSSGKQMSDIERRIKAAENLAKIPEIPDNSGTVIDLSKYPAKDFLAQMKKPKSEWTSFEVELFKQAYREKKIPEDWIKKELGARY